MHLDIVLSKTERGRRALQHREALPRPQRLFLIMIDGHKSLRELSAAAKELGIDSVALAAMANKGLIHWTGRAETIGHATGVRTPAPAPAPRPQHSLAAAKLYALDLVALMLPGRDGELREAARQVTDADALRRWLQRSAREIARGNSSERAALFLDRVGAMLPSDFFVPEATTS